MNLTPILRAKLSKFINNFELEGSADENFERFVNYHILSQDYPGIFDVDYELLDTICVGGGNDLGIDGIAITLNGKLIRTKEEVDDILSVQHKGRFTLTFIQSKNKEKFDLGEYMKFTSGIVDFLNEEIKAPANNDIDNWHDLYKYIISDDIIIKWESAPIINIIYVSLGIWDGQQHIRAHEENVRTIITNNGIFEQQNYRYIDGKLLDDIVNSNESYYTAVIQVIDSMPLPPVESVDNSSIIMCAASELIKLLTNDDVLRRNLFTDNVRDFQGDTTINQEIKDTLKGESQEFVLLNNGITIVCDEMLEVNRKITIKNPQVVNGCQTCNVLYNCYKDNVELTSTVVIVKVIAASNNNIVSRIIKGTNRQNIVYDEAFEVTKSFHKYLEEFFSTVQVKGFDKIYYERRSKQFDGDLSVKVSQKVNFRALIQSVVSLFLYKVDEGHHHESRLLSDYKNRIFKDEQSYFPYYVACFLYNQIDWMFRRKELDKKYITYRYHIMLITKELLCGKSPDINIKKEIEKYCNDLLDAIGDKDKLLNVALKACEKFDDITHMWIKDNGESAKYHIKDNPAFTNYLLKKIDNDIFVQELLEPESFLDGKILNIKTDRNGMFYGVIKRKAENIMFFEEQNPNIDMSYIGRNVLFQEVESRGVRVAKIKMIKP